MDNYIHLKDWMLKKRQEQSLKAQMGFYEDIVPLRIWRLANIIRSQCTDNVCQAALFGISCRQLGIPALYSSEQPTSVYVHMRKWQFAEEIKVVQIQEPMWDIISLKIISDLRNRYPHHNWDNLLQLWSDPRLSLNPRSNTIK